MTPATRMQSRRQRAHMWIGAVIALTVGACGTTSAPTRPTPAPTQGLLAYGRIAFSLAIGVGDRCNLMTIRADGTEQQTLANAPAGSGCYENPVWTPKGDRIVFDDATNTSDHLFSISATGGSMRELTSGSAFDSDPAISPDGTRIAFDRGGGPNPPAPGIFVMNVNGGRVTRVTTPPPLAALGDVCPSFSPDGTKLAFVRVWPDGAAIYIVGADGKGLHQVTPTAALSPARPHWSRDGSKLLFGTPNSGQTGRDVYVVNADGSDLIRLTRTYGNDYAENPAWSPDGTMIVFDQYVEGTHYVAIAVMRADGSNPTVIWHPHARLDVSPRVPSWGTAS
jgi:Tol biopolymer transport system component